MWEKKIVPVHLGVLKRFRTCPKKTNWGLGNKEGHT